jgi:DNA modification methylase
MVFREVRRVLRDDGTLWLNLGDSYAGSWGNQGRKEERGGQRPVNVGMMQPVHDGRYPSNGSNTGSLDRTPGCKNKDLVGIPWMVAFALRADGWYLRSEIIWHKPNPMPESVTDRPTKAHEQIFLLTKSPRYFYDAEAIKEPSITGDTRKPYGSDGAWAMDGRNKWDEGKGQQRDGADGNTRNRRSVWTVTPKPYKGAHFATFPPDLIRPCILAGSSVGGPPVLDPFMGSGTTGQVSLGHGRDFVGIELNTSYVDLAEQRIQKFCPGAGIIRL